MTKKADFSGLIGAVGESEESQEVSQWISTGYEPLNFAISGKYDGGFGVGRVHEIHGGESSGKTLLAQRAMIEAQKAGGAAFFCDWERTFQVGLGESLGMNTEMPFWMYKKPNSLEEGCKMMVKYAEAMRSNEYIPADAPIIAVFDSVAEAVPLSVTKSDIDDLNMSDMTARARAMSMMMPLVANAAEDYGVCVIFLNQEREKPGVMFGPKTSVPGGKSLPFKASARIHLRSEKDKVKNDKYDKSVVRQTVVAEVIKSKYTRPFQSARWSFCWDENDMVNMDTARSYIEHATEISKVLPKTGAWVTWKEKKYNSMQQLANHLTESGEIEELKAMVTK